MDIRLAGGSDGIIAAQEIVERFGIRSLFLSGHLDAQTRRRAEAVQGIAVLDKPIAPPDLLRIVAAAFERS